MTEMHTKGRITFKEDGDANHYSMLTEDGRWWLAVLANGEQTGERQIANFRRLAACWNACEGIETGWLEKYPTGFESLVGNSELVKQRDQQQARIRELEAQLNAAILARREAQQTEQAAKEARNRARVEIRRALMGRIRELEQDAARYRWLRDVSVPPHNFYISVPDEFAGVRYVPPEVDAYIDTAMAAQKGGKR